MYLGFPDMKGSGILQLTEDEIERVVCAVKGRLRGTGWWRLVWLSSFLLSGAAQREEKLVKTLIVAIKGYWLSFPPCLGDKVSISWSHRELFKTRFLRGRPVPLGCPLLRSRARARTHTHAHKCAHVHTHPHTHPHSLVCLFSKLTHCYPFTLLPPDNPFYSQGSNTEPSGCVLQWLL